MPFRPDRMRGIKPTSDLIDAKTGEVAIEAGHKMTARLAKKLADEGLKELLVSDEDLHGRYLAQDIVNLETGEIYGEAGEELDAKLLATLKDSGLKELPILDIDHVNIGAFIRNTLKVDKNSNTRGGAARHLPGHASRRAADARGGRRRCSTACSSIPSAMTCRRSAASR